MSVEIAEKIQIAADRISEMMNERGLPVTHDVALHLAREVWDIWYNRFDVRRVDASPNEIMRRMRQRYDFSLLDGPLVSQGTVDLRGAVFSASKRCGDGKCSEHRNMSGGCNLCGSPSL